MEPEISMGINVEQKMEDIKKIVYKYFHVPNIPMDDLVQEVYVAILHKNNGKSAHNPTKSSFGHYVYMVANNVSTNMVNRNRRKFGNTLSLDYVSSDEKPMIESITYEMNMMDSSHVDSIEKSLMEMGEWELARYVRSVRSGAKQADIRRAMSYNGIVMDKIKIRKIRSRISKMLENGMIKLS